LRHAVADGEVGRSRIDELNRVPFEFRLQPEAGAPESRSVAQGSADAAHHEHVPVAAVPEHLLAVLGAVEGHHQKAAVR
jgi:hypothetical protein